MFAHLSWHRNSHHMDKHEGSSLWLGFAPPWARRRKCSKRRSLGQRQSRLISGLPLGVMIAITKSAASFPTRHSGRVDGLGRLGNIEGKWKLVGKRAYTSLHVTLQKIYVRTRTVSLHQGSWLLGILDHASLPRLVARKRTDGNLSSTGLRASCAWVVSNFRQLT